MRGTQAVVVVAILVLALGGCKQPEDSNIKIQVAGGEIVNVSEEGNSMLLETTVLCLSSRGGWPGSDAGVESLVRLERPELEKRFQGQILDKQYLDMTANTSNDLEFVPADMGSRTEVWIAVVGRFDGNAPEGENRRAIIFKAHPGETHKIMVSGRHLEHQVEE